MSTMILPGYDGEGGFGMVGAFLLRKGSDLLQRAQKVTLSALKPLQFSLASG